METKEIRIGTNRIKIVGLPIIDVRLNSVMSDTYTITDINIKPITDSDSGELTDFFLKEGYVYLENCIWPVSQRMRTDDIRITEARASVFGVSTRIKVEDKIDRKTLVNILLSGEIAKRHYNRLKNLQFGMPEVWRDEKGIVKTDDNINFDKYRSHCCD